MSFRWFIYYCGMFGGCAALLGWILGRLIRNQNEILDTGFKAFFLGLIVSFTLSFLDTAWNGGAGLKRVLRVISALLVGGVGGLIGGMIGQTLYNWRQAGWALVVGWLITGLLIGLSVGIFDLVDQWKRKEPLRGARRKVQHGLLGGGLGGLLGGILYYLLVSLVRKQYLWSPSATGFVALGILIGLMIGLAQVMLKDAWLKVEEGFRAGRELILSRPEITIGRAEGCDVGLFGDQRVERLHARIVQKDGRYFIEDTGTPHGTFVNNQRINGLTPLNTGDLIRVGRNILRFAEQARRA